MTKFKKENFTNFGGYVAYEGKFVARFKHARDGAASFITFLIKNFDTEEYFSKLETGTPLMIAQEKGYLLPHIKRWLKEGGYPVTVEGFHQMIDDNAKRYRKG